MGEHIPAITEQRETHGYLEGFDRHERRWVPLLPPQPGAAPEVMARWAAVRDAMLARIKTPWPRFEFPPRAPAVDRGSPDYRRGYQSGYGAGYRAALRKHGIQE